MFSRKSILFPLAIAVISTVFSWSCSKQGQPGPDTSVALKTSPPSQIAPQAQPKPQKVMVTTIHFDASCKMKGAKYPVKVYNQTILLSWSDGSTAGWATVDPPCPDTTTISTCLGPNPPVGTPCIHVDCGPDTLFYDSTTTTAPPGWKVQVFSSGQNQQTLQGMPGQPPIQVQQGSVLVPQGPAGEPMTSIMYDHTVVNGTKTTIYLKCTYTPNGPGHPAPKTIMITATMN